MSKKKVVAVSGGFDPLHVGHVRMFQEARALGDTLIVFVNSDRFLMTKKGAVFMPLEQRIEIIKAFSCVTDAIPVIDTDQTVCETLRKYKPDIFANGGDRWLHNIPEAAVCEELGITTVFNVGYGGKVSSSSDLLKAYATAKGWATV